MSKPTRGKRERAIKPSGESLEDRQLLSAVVTGLDQQGNLWALRVIGPGNLRVTKQPGSNGAPAPLDSLTPINQILVSGADSLTTKLVGKILKYGPNSTGQVFFQDLEEIGGKAQSQTGDQGIHVIDIPQFWLTNTSANPAATSGNKATINIPDGVNSLRFGGADTSVFLGTNPANALTAQSTGSQFLVSLGIPQYHGTSIIVNKIVTTAQPASTSGGTPVQQGVAIVVTGRLNLFQANEIDGNSSIASSPFLTGTGGGVVVQATALTAGGVALINGGTVEVGGEFGAARIGGNATNLSLQSFDKMNQVYVGGETNNLSVLAVGGTHNLYFGRGLDNSTISTHVISNLQANRGAIGSRVVSDRQIGRALFGGDVLNTQVLSGYSQNLSAIFDSQQTGTTPVAQLGGGQTDLVAGNVINSFFTASVTQASDGTFGGNNILKMPTGTIQAKVEGTIDNSSASTTAPTTAFLAQHVQLKHGPVIPPNVPEPPFRNQSFNQSVGNSPGLFGPALQKFFQTGKVSYHVKAAERAVQRLAAASTPKTHKKA